MDADARERVRAANLDYIRSSGIVRWSRISCTPLPPRREWSRNVLLAFLDSLFRRRIDSTDLLPNRKEPTFIGRQQNEQSKRIAVAL